MPKPEWRFKAHRPPVKRYEFDEGTLVEGSPLWQAFPTGFIPIVLARFGRICELPIDADTSCYQVAVAAATPSEVSALAALLGETEARVIGRKVFVAARVIDVLSWRLVKSHINATRPVPDFFL